MISDIDWHAGMVTLRGTKSLRQDILPLPMETGQALADYLQHERPTTRRIGLMHASAHALRHTLACSLVENGSSLKEVADVLRHRSLICCRPVSISASLRFGLGTGAR
jgi:site-specific recombinase XerD